jgi:hypothetical protein
VPVLGATQVPQVDILLGILAHEIDAMQCLAQIGGACHAGVAIGHIKTTQLTHIPISIFLNLFKNGGVGVFAAG